MCCSSQPAGLLLRGTVPLGPPFYTRRAALRVHVRRCEHVAFAIADKRSPRARPARCETRQAKPLLFPFPAKCPESGPWPVVQWLSGRLAIRARHVARAIGTCPRYSSAPAGRADPLLSRNRKGSVPGGGRDNGRKNWIDGVAGERPMGGGKVCAGGGVPGADGDGRNWNRWSDGRACRAARGRRHRRQVCSARGLPPKGSSRWRATLVPLRRPGDVRVGQFAPVGVVCRLARARYCAAEGMFMFDPCRVAFTGRQYVVGGVCLP